MAIHTGNLLILQQVITASCFWYPVYSPKGKGYLITWKRLLSSFCSFLTTLLLFFHLYCTSYLGDFQVELPGYFEYDKTTNRVINSINSGLKLRLSSCYIIEFKDLCYIYFFK